MGGADEDAAFFVSYDGEEWPVGVSFSCEPTGNTWRAGWAKTGEPKSPNRVQAKVPTPERRRNHNVDRRKRPTRKPKGETDEGVGAMRTEADDTAILMTPGKTKKRSAPDRRRNALLKCTSASAKVQSRQLEAGASAATSAAGLPSSTMRARLEWFDACQERAAQNVAKGDPRRNYLPYLKPGTAVWNEAMRLFYDGDGKPGAVASKSDSNLFGEIPGGEALLHCCKVACLIQLLLTVFPCAVYGVVQCRKGRWS
eukprot:COSAG02_NODE_491_length_21224_cov_5.973680_24_plen_255_part_00